MTTERANKANKAAAIWRGGYTERQHELLTMVVAKMNDLCDPFDVHVLDEYNVTADEVCWLSREMASIVACFI